MVQGHIADMALDVDAAALLVYRAAWTKDMGAARVTREAAMAKLFATDRAQDVIDRAVQLHGGDGVRHGHIVERLYREIRALAHLRRRLGCAEDRHRPADPGGSVMKCSDPRPIPTLSPATIFRRRDQWPEFLLDGFDYPERLNAAVELTDRWSSAASATTPH